MTHGEFVDSIGGLRDGDIVLPCDCGILDCPGWKVNTRFDRQIAELLANPEVWLLPLAERVGRNMAMRRERALWEAMGMTFPDVPGED